MRDYSEVMNRVESKGASLLQASAPYIPLSLMAMVATLGLLVTAYSAQGSTPSFPEASALPDPLVLSNGHRVESKDQWMKERRPELKALFEHYMYGPLPSKPVQEDSKLSARY